MMRALNTDLRNKMVSLSREPRLILPKSGNLLDEQLETALTDIWQALKEPSDPVTLGAQVRKAPRSLGYRCWLQMTSSQPRV